MSKRVASSNFADNTKDYYLTTSVNDSGLPSAWLQLKDYLKRGGRLPLHFPAQEFVENKNSFKQNLPDDYYESLQIYEPIKDFQSQQYDSQINLEEPLIETDSSPTLIISQPKYSIHDSANIKIDNDGNDLLKDTSNLKEISENFDGKALGDSTEDDTTKHKVDSQSLSNGAEIDKRQATGIISSYAIALKNMAIGLAHQFNHLWNSTEVPKESSGKKIKINEDKVTILKDDKPITTPAPIKQSTIVADKEEKIVDKRIQVVANTKTSKAPKHYNPSKLLRYSLEHRSEHSDKPLTAHELDLLLNGPEKDSLVGRYIAPVNHFYFNYGKPESRANDDERHSARSYESKRVSHDYPRRGYEFDGDDASFENPLRYQRGSGSTVIERTKGNDIFFVLLIMGMCAAATTIVIAAGLYAFKIQQSRKSRHDDDPPTYGVVGPNSIASSGKGGNFAANYLIGAQAAAGGQGIVLTNGETLKQLATLDAARQELNAKLSGSAINKTNCAQIEVGVPVTNSQTGNRTAYLTNQNAAMYHYQHQKQQMISGVGERTASQHTSASDLDSEDDNDEENYTVYECPGLASAHNMEIKNPLFVDDQTPVNSPSYKRKE